MDCQEGRRSRKCSPADLGEEAVAEGVGVLRFADCELDAGRFELRRAGAVVAVEPQVLDLIVHLVRNAGRLVTKDELIATVWGGRIVSDAALASRIKSARRALGDDGARQALIKTVHGRGVRFVGDVDRAGAPAPARPPRDAAAFAQTVGFCVSRDGVRIAHAVAGEGPPLVKTGNWLTHLEHEAQSLVWGHWVRELSRGRRLVRYDQRGLGLSDWTVADLSLDRAVEDLEAVVDAHGLKRFPMVGISYGCAVAIAYAARHPERVSRLVFYGGYARGWDRRGLPELAEKRRAFATLLEHDLSSDNPALRRHYATLFVPEGTPEQIDWFGDLIRLSVSPSNARRHVLAYGATDVVPLLGRVRAPALIVHGKRDSVVPIAEGRMLAAAIPGARVLELDSANHILLEHEPAWGEFVAALRAFLAADR